MSILDVSFETRRIGPDDADFLPALHLVSDIHTPLLGKPDPRVRDLLVNVGESAAKIDLLYGAYRSARLESAALAIESPGRAAIVMAPTRLESKQQRSATASALLALKEAAWRDSLLVLEALVAPDAGDLAACLSGAGFRYLTTLLYLTRRSPMSSPALRDSEPLEWVSYAQQHDSFFCAALDQSYVQSFDCPELTNLRPTSDVLATHRARRGFDPKLWWVATRGGEVAGVLLLNRIPPQPAVEIVYIGVAQPFRATGVADALLNQATRLARDENVMLLTLAVDERNAPAKRLYARWSFQEEMSRRAFIATPVAP